MRWIGAALALASLIPSVVSYELEVVSRFHRAGGRMLIRAERLGGRATKVQWHVQPGELGWDGAAFYHDRVRQFHWRSRP